MTPRNGDHGRDEDNTPNDRAYSRRHAWALPAGDGMITVGVTHHAQAELGELVFVGLPEPGRTVRVDEEIADLESNKTVDALVSPVDGVVVEVNDRLSDEPQLVNEDPYGNGWIARIRISDPTQLDQLLDASEYIEVISQ